MTLTLRKMAFFPGIIIFSAAAPFSAHTTEIKCSVVQEKPFGNEVVRLAHLNGLSGEANFAVFKAPLAVNTDGAPNSYHPDDFKGQVLAINRIDNGVTIRRANGKALTVTEKISVFERWKNSGNWNVPAGYVITWKNVIAADSAGHPCIFRKKNAGYFGSLTAITNGLPTSEAGECQVKNQLDQRFVPAIVLRGDTNPLKTFDAKKGDLAIAINPENGVIVPAIIGDTGNGSRIGEGSVALNMALLEAPQQPKTYLEALRLDTGKRAMIVAVLPRTATFKLQRPYSAQNISARVEAWATQHGYGSVTRLADATTACSAGL